MCIGRNYTLGRNMAVSAGLVKLFDRVLSELSLKMKRLDLDNTELCLLKAIIVFNPGEEEFKATPFSFILILLYFIDVRLLTERDLIKEIRAEIYACLDDYCRQKHPNEDGRFAQLLLRLPALRSISLKCLEEVFFKHLNDSAHMEKIFVQELNRGT
jgi:nuclear receptor subfamily 2 group B member 4